MLRTAGIFLVVMGIIWALQGAELLNWPASSFMLAQQQWVLYGALTTMVGALFLWWVGRISR
ncbi:hypothetical protein ACLBKT_05505 [Erythrobacter sp. W302b]|uniref:hypothetical protein n=1 Tax=Erythrobacter sp. W302b TaxID=3389874 RepID=UPI00396B1C68